MLAPTVGCLALIVVVLTMRSRGVVRRSGIVVLVLAAIGAVASVVLGVPPVLPNLLGTILGITMLRVKAVGPA